MSQLPRPRPRALLATAAVALLPSLACAAAPAGGVSDGGAADPGLVHLRAEVERLAESARGTVGVAVFHLETGRALTLNGDVTFPMASTYKVPIAVEILSRVDAGELSLDDLVVIEERDVVTTHGVLSDFLGDPGAQLTIRNLLGLMLRVSDNMATDLLFRAAGGGEAITARMAALGAAGIRVDRPTWAIIANWLGRTDVGVAVPIDAIEYNALVAPEHLAELQDAEIERLNAAFNADPRDTATPAAMATLLRKIWLREILSEESSALLLDIMYRCQTGEARLKGVLPPGTRVAHKTGTIGETANDVGVIDLPGGAGHVVCVVFLKESKLEDNAAMEPVIAQIARAVHDYFVFHPGGE